MGCGSGQIDLVDFTCREIGTFIIDKFKPIFLIDFTVFDAIFLGIDGKEAFAIQDVFVRAHIFIEPLRGNHLSLGGGGNGGFLKI